MNLSWWLWIWRARRHLKLEICLNSDGSDEGSWWDDYWFEDDDYGFELMIMDLESSTGFLVIKIGWDGSNVMNFRISKWIQKKNNATNFYLGQSHFNSFVSLAKVLPQILPQIFCNIYLGQSHFNSFVALVKEIKVLRQGPDHDYWFEEDDYGFELMIMDLGSSTGS